MVHAEQRACQPVISVVTPILKADFHGIFVSIRIDYIPAIVFSLCYFFINGRVGKRNEVGMVLARCLLLMACIYVI